MGFRQPLYRFGLIWNLCSVSPILAYTQRLWLAVASGLKLQDGHRLYCGGTKVANTRNGLMVWQNLNTCTNTDHRPRLSHSKPHLILTALPPNSTRKRFSGRRLRRKKSTKTACGLACSVQLNTLKTSAQQYMSSGKFPLVFTQQLSCEEPHLVSLEQIELPPSVQNLG